MNTQSIPHFHRIVAAAVVLLLLSVSLFAVASAQSPDTTEIEYRAYLPLGGPSTGSAPPLANVGFGFACVNMGDETVDITFTFYDDDGAVADVDVDHNVGPAEPAQVFMPPGEGPSAASVIVTALQPIICGLNEQTTAGTLRVGTAGAMRGQDVAPAIFVTQIVNELQGFNSLVVIQNAGAEEVEVQATYYDAAGKTAATVDVSIPANSARTFDQNDGSLPADFFGSARFDAADDETPLAGRVVMYNANSAQLLHYRPVSEGGARIYLPRLTKNLSGVGYTSGWACQNLGPDPVEMTMTLAFFDQETFTVISDTLTSGVIGVNQSWGGYLGRPTGSVVDGVEQGYGGAVIEASGGAIACTGNEDNRDGGGVAPERAGQGSTYNGFVDGVQTNTVFFPQIVSGPGQFFGGFQIFPLESGTCEIHFSNGDTANIAVTALVPQSVFAVNVLTNDRMAFNGSAVVECSGPVVGIYNLSKSGPGTSGDPFATAEGTNR